MGVKIGCGGSGTPDHLVEDLNQDAEKTEKAAREKELATLNNQLLRLLLLTEVSLGLVAPFLKGDEIGGQSFHETVVSGNISNLWNFELNFYNNHLGVPQPYVVLGAFGIKGWSYSFSVTYYSKNKEIKFNLGKGELENDQLPIPPAPEWKIFKELYLENNGACYCSMLTAIYNLSKAVSNFFEAKIRDIRIREGVPGDYNPELFETNVKNIISWVMSCKEALSSSQKYQNAFQAYDPLISETCQALRETKGFVKSKKLAEIRENLERKSKEITDSVNL